MQGLFINMHRPTTKKAVKEAIASGTMVTVEATSFYGNEYEGPVDCAPVGTEIHFVGPDPERKRNFYGTILVTANGIKVT